MMLLLRDEKSCVDADVAQLSMILRAGDDVKTIE
jgi:hypothetical protein